VICGCYGKAYGRRVWNSTDERLRRQVWLCSGKYDVKGEKGCCNRHIDERELKRAFIEGWNNLVINKEKLKVMLIEQQKADDLLLRNRAANFLKLADEIGGDLV